MKILENKVELVGNKYYENMVRKCERSARTCYQSKHSKSLEDVEKFLYKLMKINHGSIIEHECLTFKIRTDRACANQIVRHRIASYSQESTRYIDLSDFDIVLDQSYSNEERKLIKSLCEEIQAKYKCFDRKDKARAVLPLCTATTLIMTMNLRELRHFLKLRLDKAAHQSIKEVAYQIYKIMENKYPVFVKDIGEMINERD